MQSCYSLLAPAKPGLEELGMAKMATETRTFLKLSDISGVEFECRKCGAKILYPIKKHYDPLPENCPSCSAPLFDNNPNLPSDQPQIVELVQKTLISLHNISDTPAVHAQVRLYLEETADAPKKKVEDQKHSENSPSEDRKVS